MLLRFLLAAVVLSSQPGWASDTFKIGDVQFQATFPTESSRIGLSSDGTVYLVSLVSYGGARLLRVSARGVGEKLFTYRGRPYLLDKYNRLYGFQPSVWREIGIKTPNALLRLVKKSPWALLTGGAFFFVSLIDQTFTGLITFVNFQPTQAFVSGFLGYLGFDLTRTLWLKSVREVTDGGNFFTDLVAQKVTKLEPDVRYDDYVLEIKQRRNKTLTTHLSQIAKLNPRSAECVDYLIRLIH